MKKKPEIDQELFRHGMNAVVESHKQYRAAQGLEKWLFSPAMETYIGPAANLRLGVLACLLVGGNLSDVARRHKKTRQACYMQAARARKLFNLVKTVD